MKKIKLPTTKQKIEKIEKQCHKKCDRYNQDRCRCICSKCPISDKYKKIVGVRLEYMNQCQNA